MEQKEYRLPRAFAEKWVKELREGNLPQTIGKLYRPISLLPLHNDPDTARQVGYCCLGVAGKVCGIDNERMANYGYLYDFAGMDNLPNELTGRDDAGTRLTASLIDLNDNARYTFLQIADWIEKEVEGYE